MDAASSDLDLDRDYDASAPSRCSRVQSLLPSISAAIAAFTSSDSAIPFLPVQTITTAASSSSSPSTLATGDAQLHSLPRPTTLHILDSSFNPPTRAHRSLAVSALLDKSTEKSNPSSPTRRRRLLLLLSTANADKHAPLSPSQLLERLSMMCLLALDILHSVSPPSSPSTTAHSHGSSIEPAIDIALTSHALFVAKSAAISSASAYVSQPTHEHLIGFDTLTRLLNPKYYDRNDDDDQQPPPPPLSALAPYFNAGHGVRVARRPVGSHSTQGHDEDGYDQDRYVASLPTDTALRDAGFQPEWAAQIRLVDAGEGAEGVSSTRVRWSACEEKWEGVDEMSGVAVGQWIRERGLYTNPPPPR